MRAILTDYEILYSSKFEKYTLAIIENRTAVPYEALYSRVWFKPGRKCLAIINPANGQAITLIKSGTLSALRKRLDDYTQAINNGNFKIV